MNEDLADCRPAHPRGQGYLWTVRLELARALKELGRRGEAVEVLRELHRSIVASVGEEHARARTVQVELLLLGGPGHARPQKRDRALMD